MTRFYWVDTQEQAAADATEKGYAADKWIFCATLTEARPVNLLEYDGVYFKAANNELELEFARIMRRNRPTW